MFKLAGEGVHNNFSSDKYCTLQKVLQAKAVHRRPVNKLEIFFLKECFKDLLIFNKIFLFSSTKTISQWGEVPYRTSAFHICA